MKSFKIKYPLLFVCIFTIYACDRTPGDRISESDSLPAIEPDYTGITIPENIAPLNFIIKEKGSAFYTEIFDGSKDVIKIKSNSGLIKIPRRKWKNLLQTDEFKDITVDVYVKNKVEGWKRFRSITNHISPDPVDPYITYRLIYPGYESWNELSICQRSLGNFSEWNIIKNSAAEENCINCHSYNNGKTDDFLFHMRGSLAGTYFYSGQEFKKVNLKTKEMKNGAVYPRWHPSGKFVAFSSNKIIQQFHSLDNQKIEVSDLESSLVLYDITKNEMLPVIFPDMEKYMDTYPEWSPDGNNIFFCRAIQIADTFDYDLIRYNLMRASFNRDKRTFGIPEMIFDAASMNKSISFPRISPDGRYVVVTLHDYGCFPIWHKEADLWSIDMETKMAKPLALNSDFTDSYHSWSSNGRWMVFSSRRDDGLATRLYLSYMYTDCTSGKPFILPVKNPAFYERFMKSYNIPEFSEIKVKPVPGKIRKISRSGAIQTGWDSD